MSIASVMPSNHLILCHPLLLLPPLFPNITVFSKESAPSIRWPKYWSFSISPSKDYSRLISFRIDWFDLLAVQGTHKSLLQHHSSKPSILWRSAFFMAQLSRPYVTTGKIAAFTRGTFVSKVTSLLFNTLFAASVFTLLFYTHQHASLLSVIMVVSSVYLRLLIFLLAILIPACASSLLIQPQVLWRHGGLGSSPRQ